MAGQLEAYIIDSLNRGYPEAKIRQLLLAQGWPASEVNSAMASVMGSSPAQGAPFINPDQPIPQDGLSQGTKKMKLRRIGVLSAAKTSAVIAVVAGIVMMLLVVGIFLALAGMVGGAMSSLGGSAAPTDLGTLDITTLIPNLIIGAIFSSVIILPIVLGIMALIGFVVGAIVAAFYNFVSGFVGGYEVEFE